MRTSRRTLLKAVGAGAVGYSLVGASGAQQTTSSGSWPQAGYDAAKTGHNPDATELTDGVTEDWTFSTFSREDWENTPVLDEGTLVFGSKDANIYGIDTEAGTESWSVETDGSIKSTAAIGDGTVFITTKDAEVRALALGNGTEVWTYQHPDNWRDDMHPTYHDGQVFLPGVVALDAAAGSVDWQVSGTDTGSIGVAVADGTVYSCKPDSNRVTALNASDGSQEWEVRIDGRVYADIQPVVDGGQVYLVTNTGNTDDTTSLHALDAATGDTEWTFDVGDAPDGHQSNPAVHDGTVFLGYGPPNENGELSATDGSVFAVDAETGDQLWEVDTTGGVVADIAVTGTTVYAGTRGQPNGTVYAIATDSGTVRWEHESDDDINSVTLAGDRLYAVLESGRIRALTSTGTATTTSTLGPATTTPSESAAEGTTTTDTTTPTGDRETPTRAGTTTGAGTATAGDPATTVTAPGTGTGATTTTTVGDDDGGEMDLLPVAGLLGLGGLVGIGAWLLNGGSGASTAAGGSGGSDGTDAESGADADSSTGTASETAGLGDDGRWDHRIPATIPAAPAITVDYDAITGETHIGAGGNADVSRATVATGGGDVVVAIKRPRVAGTLHADAVDRLLEEAETWDSLDDHDHVVGVVDYGSEPLPWIAMEYMDGGHLRDRGDEMDFRQALWTAIAVTDAVVHAHRRGVAHLDLKPENVLFRTVEGAWDVPKVADWGLSKQLLDHSKSVEGLSPHYAAPEQFDDTYGVADDITDVYQLGAVCYDLFTGRPPFEGDAARVMRQVLSETPPAPTDVNPALPPALDDILLQALAKEKADRYDHVVYLRDALEDIVDSLSAEGR